VYHFKEERTLTVSNSTEGDAVYEYEPFPLCPTCLPKDPGPNFKTGDAEAVYCQISSSIMVVFPQTAYTELGMAYPNTEFQRLFLRIE
jgi:hypothetical protein